MPTPEPLSKTLKVMGNYNRRMIALIIILAFGLAGMTVKAYFGKSSCADIQKQVDELSKSQSQIIQTNTLLAQKNQELTSTLMRADSILTNLKPDTVYISSVSTRVSNLRPLNIERATGGTGSSNGEEKNLAMSAPPPREEPEHKVKVTYEIKRTNNSSGLVSLKSIIRTQLSEKTNLPAVGAANPDRRLVPVTIGK